MLVSFREAPWTFWVASLPSPGQLFGHPWTLFLYVPPWTFWAVSWGLALNPSLSGPPGPPFPYVFYVLVLASVPEAAWAFHGSALQEEQIGGR